MSICAWCSIILFDIILLICNTTGAWLFRICTVGAALWLPRVRGGQRKTWIQNLEKDLDDLRLHPQENLTELTQDRSVWTKRCKQTLRCADSCTGSDGATDDDTLARNHKNVMNAIIFVLKGRLKDTHAKSLW